MMRTKYALVALALTALVVQPRAAGAASGELAVRWEGTVEAQASRIVIRNLSARAAQVFLGSRVLALPADGIVEIPAAGLGADPISLRSDADLLVLQAPDDFDALSLEIEKSVSSQPGGGIVPFRLGWTRELSSSVSTVRHGATGAVGVKSDDPLAQVEVAVGFVAPHSSVRIRQLDAMGNEVTFLVASASRPVRWRASLGPVVGESRVELKTLRGEAQGTAAAVLDRADSRAARSSITPLEKIGGGLGKFEPTINWQYSANLYYKVIAGPPNVCGDVYTSRNGGPYVVGYGWMCTDANGNATKGPWYYSNQTGDEDAYGYMVWSDGTSTNTARHIWDITAPSVSYTSPTGLPAPTSFYGTANDGPNGSGFAAPFASTAGGGSSSCRVQFKNTTTGLYWCGSGYNSSACSYSCTISGMPSRNVTWSVSTVPPGYAHVSGQCYEWNAYIYDNSTYGKEGKTSPPRIFCVP